ncbi:unnamed protein product [Meganyctiphanes norvegica]|uniref:Uncharacterized protein n=1 Tax=Meganyctiphanes norvegica TaxID=48144 RepID=A0AAV2R217_MEGNR
MKIMYRDLSENLPPTAVDQGDMTPTRLQVMNGKVPYLPCRVQLYDTNQVLHCLEQRHTSIRNNNDPSENDHNNKNSKNITPTWVAFVGDSKMRDKFATMVFGPISKFNWTTSWDAHTNGEYVELSMEALKKKIFKKTMQSMRAVSTDGLLQVDYVSATRGLTTDVHVDLPRPVPLLRRWATTTDNLPQLIVIGYGMWTFLIGYISKKPYLDPYDEILERWKATEEVLVSLASRTNVLVWPQGRKRSYAGLDFLRDTHFDYEAILKNNLEDKQALDWIEKAMHQALKNTGLTQWDSLVPFNLANIRECRAIREVIHRAYDSDGITVSESNTTLHRRKKRRDSAMNIQGSDIDDKPEDERKQRDNKMYPEESYGPTVNVMDTKKRERVLKEKLQANIIRVNNRVNSSLYDSLSIRNKERLNITKNTNSFIRNKIYQRYIDYISSVLKNISLKDLQSLYDSSFFKCKDALHTSEMSMQDEIQMIYNLLCNQYESKQSDLCCQV